MPRAPELQRQVQDAALPGVRVQAANTYDALGGNVADQITRAGVALYDLEKRNTDHTAVMEADTLATNEQLRIQQDVANMRGKDAANAPDYAATESAKVHDLIVKGLNNGQQIGHFESLWRQKRDTLNRSALVHSNQELERFNQDTYKANLQTSVDYARANAESPIAVAFEKDLQEQKIREHATQYGYADTPQHQEEVRALHSTTNREVINGLLAKGNDLEAKAYFDHLLSQEKAAPNNLQFTAADRDPVEKNVLEGATRGASRRLVQHLTTQYGDGTPEQQKQILSAIDKHPNDKVADAARERFLNQVNVNKQIRAEQYTQTYAVAAKTLDQAARQNPMATARELIPAPMWNQMQPTEQHSLEQHRKWLVAPEERTHNLMAWLTANNIQDDALAKLRPEAVAHIVGDFDAEHADRFVNYWRSAKNKAEKGGSDLSVLPDRELNTNALEQTRIWPIDTAKSQWSMDQLTSWSRAEDQLAGALSRLPKDASFEEKQKVRQAVINNQIMQKFTVDPGFFSKQVPAIFNKQVPAIGMQDIKDPRSIRIPLKEIPQGDQDVLDGILRLAGKPLTTDKKERMYALKKMREIGQISGEEMKSRIKAIALE